jgi:peptide/nickel transport system ATP-binding protein
MSAAAGAPGAPLLAVRDLRTSFRTDRGIAHAVDGVSFEVRTGETVALVGESGCGKTATVLSLLGLLPPSASIEPGGSVEFERHELLRLDPAGWRAVRGARIGIVFQDAASALDPVFRVGDQVAEVVRAHVPGIARRLAWARAIDTLAATCISGPSDRALQYPHELSGGTQQRVMLAIALVMRPALLIADEPTTALDATVQAEILALLADLRRRLGMAILLVTHDLGVAAAMADRVVVMYAGEIVEDAPADRFFAEPHHPYARGLLRAMPQLARPSERLAVIPGSVPAATAWPGGCRFHPRCALAWDRCTVERPPLYALSETHRSRCHLAEEPWRRPAPDAGFPAPVATPDDSML